MKRTNRRAALGIGCLAAVLSIVMAPEAGAAELQPHAYSVGHIYYSQSSWNAAKATMEVHSGSIDSADVINIPGSGGFAAQVLWAMNDSGSSWVELGYTRGWKPAYPSAYNILTAYWATRQLDGNYYEHRVTGVSVADEDVRTFKILKAAGDNNWSLYIGTSPATDSSGDAMANGSIGNNFRAYDCGLEVSATSARLGTSADPTNDTYIMKSSDGGSSWSYGPSVGYDNTDPDVGGYGTWGGWDAPGQSLHNHRNSNP
jgi:hypothetical protein